jgi:hypothetical protein
MRRNDMSSMRAQTLEKNSVRMVLSRACRERETVGTM